MGNQLQAIAELAMSLPVSDRQTLAERLVGRSLDDRQSNKSSPAAISPLLNKQQVAHTLCCSMGSVHRLVATGQLLHVAVGSRVLFDPADVAKYIARHKHRGVHQHRTGRPRVGTRIAALQ